MGPQIRDVATINEVALVKRVRHLIIDRRCLTCGDLGAAHHVFADHRSATVRVVGGRRQPHVWDPGDRRLVERRSA